MPSSRQVSLLLLLVCCLCVVMPSTVRAQEAPPLPTTEELAQLIAAYDVPGIAMASLTGCEVDTSVLVAGLATLTPKVAITSKTVFEAASLSKPVFAYLVLSLVEEGIVDLDQPLAETCDYARLPDKEAYAKITPRMILTHRTGLPNWVDGDTPFYERKVPIPFEASPGTTYSYSGEAFQLLQAFVEYKTGQQLQDIFHERLGDVMPHSTFRAPLSTGLVLSRGYRSAGDPGSGRDLNLEDRGAVAYSLITTAEDYAHFLAHVCRRDGLDSDTYVEMFRPQAPLPEDEGPFPTSYGLGWMVADLPEGTFIGHGGNNDEYRAFAGFLSESGDGFTVFTNGAKGQDVIDFLLTPPSVPDSSLSAPEAIFETFWTAYNEGYALFDVKHVDWDAVYRVYRPRITAETTDDELWVILAEMGNLLNDIHVTLTDPDTGDKARSGGRSIGVGPFEDGTFSLNLIDSAYAVGGLTGAADGIFKYGWLPDSVGYVHISRFRDPDASAAAIDSVLAYFAGAVGLVVDVRHNGGGDDRAGQVIASRFVAEANLYMTVAMRKIGQVPAAFTEPVEWWLRPEGAQQFTKPIVLLIDSRSISAAENFALAMRVVPHALIMGETTAGVMADAATQPLPNGWEITIPINVFRDPNGLSWEGIGITPDLWVKNEPADVKLGTDKALKTALDFLNADAVEANHREVPKPMVRQGSR